MNCNDKILGRVSLKDVAWLEDAQLIFLVFHTFVCKFGRLDVHRKKLQTNVWTIRIKRFNWALCCTKSGVSVIKGRVLGKLTGCKQNFPGCFNTLGTGHYYHLKVCIMDNTSTVIYLLQFVKPNWLVCDHCLFFKIKWF